MGDVASGVNPARLFVGNLAYSVRDEQLKELFSQYGEVEEATVLMLKQYSHSNRPPLSRGMGFVTFADPAAAQAAIAALHNQDFEGRPLIVEVAKPRVDKSERDQMPMAA